MSRILHFTAAALLAFSVGTAQASAESVDTAPSAVAMAADLLVARPIGLVATVLGTGLFIVQLPLAIFTREVADPGRKLVVEPARYTFTRPLGEMD